MSQYKMFFSDFDGTLVRGDHIISERCKKAIASYRAAGGVFCLCTGRGFSAILPRLKELNLTDGYVIAFQGGAIKEVKTGNLIQSNAFALSDALDVIGFFEQMDCHLHVYTLNDFYCNKQDDWLPFYEETCAVRAEIQENLYGFTLDHKLSVMKTLVMVEPEKRDELYQKTRKKFGDRFFVTCSSDWLVEVAPFGQNKGEAIKAIAKRENLPLAQIAAIGDQENDLPMLETAGGKFTVKNGVEALKKIAIEVPSNEEDGVAVALEKYVMGETL